MFLSAISFEMRAHEKRVRKPSAVMLKYGSGWGLQMKIHTRLEPQRFSNGCMPLKCLTIQPPWQWTHMVLPWGKQQICELSFQRDIWGSIEPSHASDLKIESKGNSSLKYHTWRDEAVREEKQEPRAWGNVSSEDGNYLQQDSYRKFIIHRARHNSTFTINRVTVQARSRDAKQDKVIAGS